MSRYMVNKLMWEVDSSGEALASFQVDPAGFLDAWEQLAGRPVPPVPRGGRLTQSERAALVSRDYGALYAMGVSQFLLWQFARSVSVPGEKGIEELIVSFRAAVEPVDSDFST